MHFATLQYLAISLLAQTQLSSAVDLFYASRGGNNGCSNYVIVCNNVPQGFCCPLGRPGAFLGASGHIGDRIELYTNGRCKTKCGQMGPGWCETCGTLTGGSWVGSGKKRSTSDETDMGIVYPDHALINGKWFRLNNETDTDPHSEQLIDLAMSHLNGRAEHLIPEHLLQYEDPTFKIDTSNIA